MPLKIPAVTWYYCKKNRVWTIRGCTHMKCKPAPSRVSETRPTDPPR